MVCWQEKLCDPHLSALEVRFTTRCYTNLHIPLPLPLRPLTLKLVRIIVRGVDNLPTNFCVCRTFRSRFIGQHLSDASRDLATLTFELEVLALVGDAGLRTPSVYQV